MAKLSAPASSVTRSDVLKVRGRAMLVDYRGEIVVKKWPKRRGSVKSPRAAAWMKRFACVAREMKSPFPQMLDAAEGWAKGQSPIFGGPKGPTGWYYRDVLETASYGKLIRFQGEVKVRTPAVHVSRSTAESLTSGVAKKLTPNQFEWDNNSFWSSTLNPTRLTMKAPGLYLIGANVFFPVNATAARGAWLIVNNSIEIANSQAGEGTNTFGRRSVVGCYYFHANDYVECFASAATTLQTAQLHDFWAVAITPEALIP